VEEDLSICDLLGEDAEGNSSVALLSPACSSFFGSLPSVNECCNEFLFKELNLKSIPQSELHFFLTYVNSSYLPSKIDQKAGKYTLLCYVVYLLSDYN
jgi:hypothetical protein